MPKEKEVIDVEVKDVKGKGKEGGEKRVPMNVFSKLQRARVMLQECELKKSGNNKFSGFTYFELGDFLPYVNEIFDELGLFSQFNLYDNEIAKLVIANVDNTDETVEFSTPVASAEVFKKGSNDLAMLPIQILGSQHTYLKRYLYLNALEIVEGDVLDATLDNKEGNYGSKSTTNDKKRVVERVEQKSEQPTVVKGNATTTKGNSTTNTFDFSRWIKATETLRDIGWDYKDLNNREEVLTLTGLPTDNTRELSDTQKHILIKGYGEIYMRLRAEQEALANLTEENIDE
jgi:hypothetical protein